MRVLTLGLPLFLALSFGCGGPAGDARVGPLEPAVPLWGRFEARLDLPVPAGNPYDPAEISVEAAFQGPDGTSATVPGFVTRQYRRELVGGYEKLQPAGEPEWRVRFTPCQAGSWSWRWRAVTPGGETASDWSRFQVEGPAPGRHGFLRVSGAQARYLAFDDGTPYFAVGENLCWYDGRGSFAYEDWLAKLARQGVNYIRLWMPSWAFGLEWTERDGSGNLVASSLGNYERRLERAWQLDRVLETAEAYGIYVMLCIQNHGAFSRDHNSEWEDNPYNARNGGPLETPREFFSDAEARSLFERRLRYLVARWGHLPNLLAWELWNEADLAEPPPLASLVDWHARMAEVLHGLDPYDRPVTTSLSAVSAIVDTLLGTQLFGPLWGLSRIDLVQLHFYTVGEIGIDFSALFPRLVETLRGYGKPVLIGEAGVDYRGPAETLRADPEGEGFHDLVWSGIFSGCPGTGMTWWWDNVIDPQDWYFHLGAAARFTEGVDFAGEGLESVVATAAAPGLVLAAQALAGGRVALVRVRNVANQWFHPDPAEVAGAGLELAGLAGGRWRGQWLDTRRGETVSAVELLVESGTVTLPVPPFRRDVALRLERVL